VVDGGEAARKMPHAPARGGHALASKIYSRARKGWRGVSLVAKTVKKECTRDFRRSKTPLNASRVEGMWEKG
jgi:hypothetical protein